MPTLNKNNDDFFKIKTKMKDYKYAVSSLKSSAGPYFSKKLKDELDKLYSRSLINH